MWNKVLKIFAILYFPILLLTFVLIFYQKEEQLSGLVQVEERGAAYKKNYLLDLYTSLVFSTQYWSEIDYPKDFDPLGEHSKFIDNYIEIINGFQDYDQFRFLDLKGKEFFRYQREDDKNMVFGPLQNKENRSYVQSGLALKRGEIFLSAIDLNRENGVLETPYKPVVRGVAPIFNTLNEKIGIVVINYRMSRILNQLKAQITNGNFYLTDANFNIITSNTRPYDLGYEIQKSGKALLENYSLTHLPLKKAIDTNFVDQGSVWTFKVFDFKKDFISKEGIFSTIPIIITPTDWVIVQEISPEFLGTWFLPLYKDFLIFNFFAVIALLILSYYIIKSRQQQEQFYVALEAKNKALLGSKAQLEKNNYQIQDINKSLSIKNDQLKEFNYLVSHNLRSPVTSLSVIIDMLKEEKEPDKIKALLPKMATVSNSIYELTEDIRAYMAILDQNEIKVEFLNVPKLIALVKNEFSDLMLGEQNLKVLVYFKEWEAVSFSKLYLKSILQNFISNAIKYRDTEKSESYVLFEGKIENGAKVLYVKDNGVGINLERHGANVFKLYKRFHRNISGKGVGLFLVKSQLEALNAQISVDSKEGLGTSFKINF
ncbi:sensor histidine kinase [Cellulophaga baltica]|uniref:sensor histidine kinase n=1 Tax=Cellulophaga baltica TaxID=76594 RepID=UPI0021471CFE|nr:sensor histidine kinase [Cellulophaga baltica]MCR1024560.1 sensor histidine kinase [Cellulophaga baltica]